MKTLYIDCGMGAAGDMLTAALLELLPEEERGQFVDQLNSLDIPGVSFVPEKAQKCGITGTHMKVTVEGMEEDEHMHDHEHSHDNHVHDHHHEDHEHSHDDHDHDHCHGDHEHSHDEHDHDHHHGHSHSHNSLHGIEHIVRDHLQVSDKVKEDIIEVYKLIAEAESHVHGVPMDEIHFHEVGTMDAIADVTAVCLLMELIAPEKIIASPVHVGAGTVRCAHGVLPVPAPATAYILRGVPIYGGRIPSELCTPTGAALLKHFAQSFQDMPVMETEAIGYGMGKKDFERANCVRAILGRSKGAENVIDELSFNVDDMTAEEIGFAMDILLANGAVEVFTVPVGMKKCRPGTLVNVMCKEADKDKIIELIFRHTTTLGIRERISKRYTLDRRIETVDSEFGPVRKKVSEGYGVTREKYEYDDLSRIAKDNNLSISQVRERL